MTCDNFGRDQICTQVNAGLSSFGHPTQVSSQVQLAATCDYLRVRLTRALKKSANNDVFEDISKVFQSCLLSIEFIEETCIIRPVQTGRTMRRTNTVLYSSSRIYTGGIQRPDG